MLNPPPVSPSFRGNTKVRKASPGIMFIETLIIALLVPHGFCNDIIKLLELLGAFSRKSRTTEGITNSKTGINIVMKEHVHLCHCKGDGVQLLPIELWSLRLILWVVLFKEQTCFNQQAT